MVRTLSFPALERRCGTSRAASGSSLTFPAVVLQASVMAADWQGDRVRLVQLFAAGTRRGPGYPR